MSSSQYHVTMAEKLLEQANNPHQPSYSASELAQRAQAHALLAQLKATQE